MEATPRSGKTKRLGRAIRGVDVFLRQRFPSTSDVRGAALARDPSVQQKVGTSMLASHLRFSAGAVARTFASSLLWQRLNAPDPFSSLRHNWSQRTLRRRKEVASELRVTRSEAAAYPQGDGLQPPMPKRGVPLSTSRILHRNTPAIPWAIQTFPKQSSTSLLLESGSHLQKTLSATSECPSQPNVRRHSGLRDKSVLLL